MQNETDYFEDGFVSLPGLLSGEIAAAYLSVMQNAMGQSKDQQHRFLEKKRAVTEQSLELLSDNFSFSLTFLWSLTPIMEQVTGKRLLPSYAYGRVYPKGAQLDVHSDRQSNEHSLNLTLGYSDDIPWAFSIERYKLSDDEILNPEMKPDFGGRDFTDIAMKPGDAVAYRGVNFRHARLQPNPNVWSAHLFLGWVDRDGPFKESAFDGMALPPPAKFYF